jgi:ABC-type transporter Mla MlaB component
MLNDGPLTFDSREGRNPGTRVFSLSGPLTLRNLFELQTELRGTVPPPLTIIDLSGVPYMDSAGMGRASLGHPVRGTDGATLGVTGPLRLLARHASPP